VTPSSFSALGLSTPLLQAVKDQGYTHPTPIQLQTIPAVLAGKDVMAAAQTGTGKTAAFALPLLQRLTGSKAGTNHIRALILTPTRELAIQVAESFAAYGRHLPLKSGVVYGGVKINPQMMQLRGGLDVLVATPGRLLDLFSQNAVQFSQVETLILDEADRMLDLGFSDDLGKIMALLPKKRQSLLFSATFSDEIKRLTGQLLHQPVRIEVSPPNSAATGVKQWVYEIDSAKKAALLSHLLRNRAEGQVLVFTRTKKGADRLVGQLKREQISAAAIHGDKSQTERTRTLADFKAARIRVLIATDIAARGIDIHDLPRVINFDLPKVAEDYIHRIGRTGRAGAEGEAISLVSADEVPLLTAIETLLRRLLPRETVAGFVPKHNVPLTTLQKAKPKKPKKPKKTTVPAQPQAEPPPNRHRKPRWTGNKEEDTPKTRGKQGRGRGAVAGPKGAGPKGAAPRPNRTTPKKKNRG